MSAELTEEEAREILIAADDPNLPDEVFDAVKSIVAARLAAVEAELDKWRSAFHQAGVDANSYAERAEAAEALVEAGLALADECAESGCIHLNEMYGRLRTVLGGAR